MDTAAYEIRLKDLHKQLNERFERVEKHIKHRDEPLSADSADQAIERLNDDVVFALDENLSIELRAIDAALKRIVCGEFGVCTRCGGEVELARLDAIPYAATCIKCKDLH